MGTFAGGHDNLSELDPRGLLVLESLSRVIFSGKYNLTPSSNPPPSLVLYDLDLKEIDRFTPRTGMVSGGQLFYGKNTNEIIGISTSDNVLYRYNIKDRKLIDYVALGQNIGPVTQRLSDGTIWILVGSTLIKVDSSNLELQAVGTLSAAITMLQWLDRTLYVALADPTGTAGSQLGGISGLT